LRLEVETSPRAMARW